jgi:preprotein translocase subunit YajC
VSSPVSSNGSITKVVPNECFPVARVGRRHCRQPPAWLQFLPIAVMGVVVWFLLLRPADAAAEERRRAKLDALKKGDQVLTGGGFIGKVVRSTMITSMSNWPPA